VGHQKSKELEVGFKDMDCGAGIEEEVRSDQAERIDKLRNELSLLSGSDSLCDVPPDCPPDMVEAGLQDIIAFESVESGVSLFEGLQRNGMDLPPPKKLNEKQSRRKVMEILKALVELRVFLIGFDGMDGRDLYATLWHQTLWEGCYVRRRCPEAITLIDVSHKMQRSEMRQYLDSLFSTGTIH